MSRGEGSIGGEAAIPRDPQSLCLKTSVRMKQADRQVRTNSTTTFYFLLLL